MMITRLGHAALLVQSATTRILIDPGTFCDDAAFALTELDAIVVTHQHPDHLDVERAPALLDANPEAVLVSDPETAEQATFGDWFANSDGTETTVGDLYVHGIGSQHAQILPEIARIANVGVVISDGTTALFHPGDTYEHAPGGIDVLAVPLGAPWAKLSETVEFVQRVAPTTILPIHDRTIAEVAYGMYWGHIATHGGVSDARLLGQSESTAF